MLPLLISSAAGIAAAAAARPKNPKEKTPIKNVIAVGLGAGLAFGIYKLIGKDIRNAINKRKNNTLFDEEKSPDKKLSYKPSQYITWADKLEDAFEYIWGTDEDAIYSILRKLKTNNDWLELNRAFGMRTYRDYTDSEFMFGKDVNLSRWFQLELDTKEKAKCNAILKSKGITYRV
jgi:hypothetical protein